MELEPCVRDDLLAAIRLVPAGAADREALEQHLYTAWFAQAGPAAGSAVVLGSGWSQAGWGSPPPVSMARVYWNCPPDLAAELIAALGGTLVRLRLPHRLKWPTVAPLFDRCEPVVLYLGIAEWAAAKTALREVHATLAGRLRRSTPPLTLRVAPGVAVAEDPGDGSSFGQSRAAAVAAGILRARGEREDAVLAAIAATLAAHGISAERPYLRAGGAPDRLTAW